MHERGMVETVSRGPRDRLAISAGKPSSVARVLGELSLTVSKWSRPFLTEVHHKQNSS
jgi:hypothetical protein